MTKPTNFDIDPDEPPWRVPMWKISNGPPEPPLFPDDGLPTPPMVFDANGNMLPQPRPCAHQWLLLTKRSEPASDHSVRLLPVVAWCPECGETREAP